jgi:chromosome segregation ATPase
MACHVVRGELASATKQHAAALDEAKGETAKAQAAHAAESQRLTTALHSTETTIAGLKKQLETQAALQTQLAKLKSDSDAAAGKAAAALTSSQAELAATHTTLIAARQAESAAKQQLTDALASIKVFLFFKKHTTQRKIILGLQANPVSGQLETVMHQLQSLKQE